MTMNARGNMTTSVPSKRTWAWPRCADRRDYGERVYAARRSSMSASTAGHRYFLPFHAKRNCFAFGSQSSIRVDLGGCRSNLLLCVNGQSRQETSGYYELRILHLVQQRCSVNPKTFEWGCKDRAFKGKKKNAWYVRSGSFSQYYSSIVVSLNQRSRFRTPNNDPLF